MKLIARDRVGRAIRKRALEWYDQPTPEERWRGVLALGRVVGREYHSGIRDLLERVLEFVLGQNGVAAGDRLEHRRTGQVAAGKVGTNVRQLADEPCSREPIILQLVEAHRSDIAFADEYHHSAQIRRLAVGAVSYQKY